MTPDLDALRAAADEADARYWMHIDRCPTSRVGRFCQKCDDLDLLANHAESAYRRARLAVVGAGVMTPTATEEGVMTPDLAALRAAADEADARYWMHNDRCRTSRNGFFCRKCDDLDLLANHAESAYRRARLAGSVAS